MPKIVDHDHRREQVAEAVWRTIADVGLERATVREIAREAGCSTGVLQHYFSGKDELVMYAMRLAFDRAVARVNEIQPGENGLESLRIYLLANCPVGKAQRQEALVWVSFWARAVTDPRLASEQRKRYDLWRRHISRVIKEGQADGSIRADVDPRTVARAAVTMVDGLASQTVIEGLTGRQVSATVDAFVEPLAAAPYALPDHSENSARATTRR